MESASLADRREFSPQEVDIISERAAVLGLQMRTGPHQFTHIPFALTPANVPKEEFERALHAMPIFNRLIDAIARDRDWLYANLEGMDEFTNRLIHVSKQCTPPTQPLYLGIHRSDYMLSSDSHLQQVEINTISSAFAPLATKLRQLHTWVLTHFPASSSFSTLNLPENGSFNGLIEAFFEAWKLQGDKGIVLMVIGENEKNLFDQSYLDTLLWETHQITVIKATFVDLRTNFRLEPGSNKGFYKEFPVSIVYYRTGYAPENYKVEEDWTVRETLERCTAVKCPSINYHLAGVKKVQQLLCNPDILSRFLPDLQEQQEIRSFFTVIVGLDGPISEEMSRDVLERPGNWVLKPMREGGGNNLYDGEITTAFQMHLKDSRHLKGYILMRKIAPRPVKVLLVRNGEVNSTLGQWELGVFGTYIGDGRQEYWNKAPGHLLRTKSSSANEGGVAAGYAVLDTPYLV